MDELNKNGLILFIIGALGFLSILGYGVYMAFGWLGVIIYASMILMILGVCFMRSDWNKIAFKAIFSHF